jgi:hypothetical protein
MQPESIKIKDEGGRMKEETAMPLVRDGKTIMT